MYYLISFMYKSSLFYCIWVSDDEDYVLSCGKKIMCFSTIDAVDEYSKNNNILVKKDEDPEFNLDRMIQWCEDVNNHECNCEEILNLWNIFTDIANGLKEEFVGNDEEFDDLYKKIFDANGLFSEELNSYNTIFCFSEDEVTKIKKIVESGIKLITENI